jgi:hypothetical protein
MCVLIIIGAMCTVVITMEKMSFAKGTIGRLEKQCEEAVNSNKELMATMQQVCPFIYPIIYIICRKSWNRLWPLLHMSRGCLHSDKHFSGAREECL